MSSLVDSLLAVPQSLSSPLLGLRCYLPSLQQRPQHQRGATVWQHSCQADEVCSSNLQHAMTAAAASSSHSLSTWPVTASEGASLWQQSYTAQLASRHAAQAQSKMQRQLNSRCCCFQQQLDLALGLPHKKLQQAEAPLSARFIQQVGCSFSCRDISSVHQRWPSVSAGAFHFEEICCS